MSKQPKAATAKTPRKAAPRRPVAKKAATPKTTPVAATPPMIKEAAMIEEAAAASEQLDRMSEFVRKSAESGLGHSQSFLDQLNDAANKASVSFDEATNQSKKAAEDLSLCAMDAVQSYAELTFSFARAITTAGSIGEVVNICGEHSRKQFEQVSKSSNDLQAAFGIFAKESAKPFSISASLPMID